MADKILTSLTILASPAALTNTLAVLGAVTKVGSLAYGTLWCDYTRAGASVTGRPILAVEVSRDPPDTASASVAHWSRVPVVDTTTFSSGAMEQHPESRRCNPTAAGASTFGWPGIDLRGANWLRVLAADVDGGNPGTAAFYLSGTVNP